MRIEAVNVSMPSQEKDNKQIIDLIRQHSRDTFNGDLEQTLTRVNKLLNLSGAKSRRWLAAGEKPFDHIQKAVFATLTEAEVDKDEIDLLIYVGIGKGFLEPGQSYLVAHALSMGQVECFDLVDACMSWSRAMHIAEGFFLTKRYQRILIVNAEFGSIDGGYLFPHNYQLHNPQQLEWTFASYTIGNAATATLVSADPNNPWTWRFSSRPDLADLCSIHFFQLGLYSKENDRIGRNGALHFTSFGQELHTHALEPCVSLIREIYDLQPDIKCIFPHASSYREWDKFARKAGVQDKIHHIYPMYGNLVSASVPAGLALAWHNGLVNRGDRVAGWVGSAGMSFAGYSFTL
ncbi:3-oxoacyl-[acyl-carrier-protein] synthase III C-terminal domain-containing protein [Merismopedia glauca]|uniref:3-oxoacyl-ACP reductase n=1 Tax=Merismopedia glauca CCAP 1448/3 TaxID=1296344 RepID=A0A2T1BY13_9CYAN|nr:3-oxoacyl-[acyl-carrier-protein] synthase III C-terminal domain-containing protein [Merismopedia glauca]PSB00824.1 3-oxoacyl-ACP reductase [Merismopedia glauca CCAP 1448/3]